MALPTKYIENYIGRNFTSKLSITIIENSDCLTVSGSIMNSIFAEVAEKLMKYDYQQYKPKRKIERWPMHTRESFYRDFKTEKFSAKIDLAITDFWIPHDFMDEIMNYITAELTEIRTPQ